MAKIKGMENIEVQGEAPKKKMLRAVKLNDPERKAKGNTKLTEAQAEIIDSIIAEAIQNGEGGTAAWKKALEAIPTLETDKILGFGGFNNRFNKAKNPDGTKKATKAKKATVKQAPINPIAALHIQLEEQHQEVITLKGELAKAVEAYQATLAEIEKQQNEGVSKAKQEIESLAAMFAE